MVYRLSFLQHVEIFALQVFSEVEYSGLVFCEIVSNCRWDRLPFQEGGDCFESPMTRKEAIAYSLAAPWLDNDWELKSILHDRIRQVHDGLGGKRTTAIEAGIVLNVRD